MVHGGAEGAAQGPGQTPGQRTAGAGGAVPGGEREDQDLLRRHETEMGIAQALLGHPKLLVLDEPTAGLDPKERVRFRGLIASLGKQSIVLVSTHIVSDLAHIADVILLMKDGRIIHQGPASEIADLEAFYLEAFGEEGEHGGTVSL